MNTEAFHRSAVDVDSLPGIADVCQGRLPAVLRRGLEQAMTDAVDFRAAYDVARKVSWTLGLLPDADGSSAVWSLTRPVSVTLAAGHLPPTGRVVFGRDKGVLKARVLAGKAEDDVVHEAPTTVGLGVAVKLLIGGVLDECFKRASIVKLLDVADGRKKAAALRSVAFTVEVTADEERLSVRLLLKPPKTTLAPYRTEEHSVQRLYVNHGVAQLEPDAHLPVEDGDFLDSETGQQAPLSNVLHLKRNPA